MKTILISFVSFLVFSATAYSADKKDHESALELVDTIHVERDIQDVIETILSITEANLPRNYPESEDMSNFVLDEYRRILNSKFDWGQDKVEVAELVARTYSEREVRAYLDFLESVDGGGYFRKTHEFDEKLSLWIKDKLEGVEGDLRGISSELGENYLLKLREEKPRAVEEVVSENYYDIKVYKCYWPIPNDMILFANNFDGYRFVSKRLKLTQGRKQIEFSKIDVPIVDELKGVEELVVEDMGVRNGFKLIEMSLVDNRLEGKVDPLFVDEDEGRMFAVEKDGIRTVLTGVDEVELEYMLARCDATKKEY